MCGIINTIMINWNRRKYTKEEFIDAWNKSESMAQCAKKLGLTIYGSTYNTLRTTSNELDLNKDHMTGRGHLKGKRHNYSPKRKIIEVLSYGKIENTFRLKARLFEEKIKEYICEKCGGTEWMGKKIPLALDHIDGDRLNNCLANLRILCYNCHGQTETYCKKK